jgi:hypothetical protein
MGWKQLGTFLLSFQEYFLHHDVSITEVVANPEYTLESPKGIHLNNQEVLT